MIFVKKKKNEFNIAVREIIKEHKKGKKIFILEHSKFDKKELKEALSSKLNNQKITIYIVNRYLEPNTKNEKIFHIIYILGDE